MKDGILREFIKLGPNTRVLIQTIDGNKFDCIFMEINPNLTVVNVKNFITPLGELKDAALRMADIETILIK